MKFSVDMNPATGEVFIKTKFAIFTSRDVPQDQIGQNSAYCLGLLTNMIDTMRMVDITGIIDPQGDIPLPIQLREQFSFEESIDVIERSPARKDRDGKTH